MTEEKDQEQAPVENTIVKEPKKKSVNKSKLNLGKPRKMPTQDPKTNWMK